MLLDSTMNGKLRHSHTTRCCLTARWDIAMAEDTTRTQEGYQVYIQLNTKLLQAADTSLEANENTDPRLFQNKEHLWAVHPTNRSISATIAPLLPHLLLPPLWPPCTQDLPPHQAHVTDPFPRKLVPLCPGRMKLLDCLKLRHKEKLGEARAPEYSLKVYSCNSLRCSC